VPCARRLNNATIRNDLIRPLTPMDTTTAKMEVLFHPLPYGTRPIKIAVTLAKDGKVRNLKTAICERYNAERTSANQPR